MTATDFITSLGLQRPTQQDLRKWNEEYEAVDASLMSRYASVGLVCPPQWAVGTESARALYLLTRWLRPRVFVETGVANGHSSFVLLSAMEANAAGSLVSLDVVPDAGCLVTEQLSSRWQLLVLDPADPIAAAAEGLAGVDEVDIFFHDADHSYVGQLADYELADAVLARGRLGLMLSDDVDESFAFIEHVRRRGLRPSLLVDGPKVMGACWSKQQAVADASTQASRPA
jgi:predicted O-methyltransferase YrrM